MRPATFLPGIIWLIITIVLLTLPGNDLPHADLFNIPYFDKYVHLIMFFMLTTLFCYPFVQFSSVKPLVISWFNKITVYVVLYGVAMEFVQKFWTRGRSFDLADILFDCIGSIVGLLVVRQYYHKKIGPDGNRGRNQN